MNLDKKNINWKEMLYNISLLFLFCFFIQLLGFPNKFALLGSSIICAYHIIVQKRIQISIREILLALALFTYIYISKHTWSDIIVITLVPTLFTFVGKYITIDEFSEKGGEKRILFLVMVYVLGYSVHGLLNAIIYFQQGFAGAGRSWNDIWGKNLLATHQNIYVLPLLALMFPAFIYLKKYVLICISVVIGGVFFLYYSIDSLSRIPVMIWGICLLWGFVLFFIFNKNRKAEYPGIKKIVIGFVILLAIAILVIISNFDTIKNLAFVQRMSSGGGIIHNIRFRAQINAIRQLFDYPFGGYQMDLCGLKHCHNVWLDIANAGGLIPFGLMIAYTILSAVDVVRFLYSTRIGIGLKYIVSSLYLSLILYYIVEPALMADVRFFVPWTYLNGIICGCNVKCRDLKEDQG